MKWRAGLYKAVIGNNGYAGATRCQALSDFAQVSDHGFQAFQTGQLLRAEAPGIVPDRIECGEVQRRRAWKFFLNCPLRVSSVDITAFSHTK